MKKPAFVFSRLDALSAADAVRLAELSRQLDGDASFDVKLLRRSMRTGVTRIFVLRDAGRIVAGATAVVFSTPTGRHCRIEDVIVDEAMRGLGLGREIMARVLTALRRTGIGSVELTSRPSRVAARTLYRSLGFEKRETDVFKLEFGKKQTCKEV